MNQDKLVPILAGGAFIGITAAFPFINLLNLCCCLLIIVGGVLTSYIYIKRVPPGTPVNMGDGALLGLLAGLIGAVVEAIMSIPLQMIQGSLMDTSELVEILQQDPNIPPEFADALATVLAGGVGGGLFIVGLLISLVITGAFAAGGGVLGVALFGQSSPPPSSPPVTTYVPPTPGAPPTPQPPPQTPPTPTAGESSGPEGGSGGNPA